MRLQLFLRLPRFFLRVLQGFFLLAELARQADDPRAVGERVPLVFRNFLVERGAPGALHVLLLTEGEPSFSMRLISARRTPNSPSRASVSRVSSSTASWAAVTSFSSFCAPSLAFFALLAQRVGALSSLAMASLQAGQKLLGLGDSLLRPVAAQNKRGTFQNAQLVAQIQVAPRGFAGLFQRLKLAFQLGDDILHAGEVVAHVGKGAFRSPPCACGI